MTDVTRPLRADARRNYERLLIEARAAFEIDGVNTSLERIARAAGVGIGTLYRHFPTREALMEAVLREHFARLTERADELCLMEGRKSRAALTSWLREFTAASAAVRGLSAAVATALREERSDLRAACDRMNAAIARLLAHAQNHNGVRRDTDHGDLLAIAYAIAWVTEQRPADAGLADRLVALVVDGLDVVHETPG
ncbi:TetR/AcrR family transcriptional regulator [Micromonospora rubida]|uniref:TetR/AcrR family transcriptional regulator n=1 Tax=Micromonospora rubida TaxID=2697657 RepID=UPI002E2C377D|nr:TetR/AcrR family transcriptional regulator [Micromonospora rubida]